MQQRAWLGRLLLVISFVLFLTEIVFAGAPIPWGAKLIREDVAVTGSAEERTIASYETKASKQELLNYYLKEMPNRGYNLFMKGEHNLVFNKSGELVIVVISPSQDGKTNFMVTTASIKSIPDRGNTYSAEIICEPIPLVPAYPGARCMDSTRLKSGSSRTAAYSAEDPVSVVLNFYRDQMPRYNWQMNKEINLKDVMSQAIQEGGQHQVVITPEQRTMMQDIYGNVHGLFFANQKGNSCVVNVMENPTNKGAALINIVYEDKVSKQ